MSSATIRDLRVYDVFREITTYMLFDMIYISASFLNNVILLYLGGVCFICENTFTNKQLRRLSTNPRCAWIWTLISRQHHVSTKTNIFEWWILSLYFFFQIYHFHNATSGFRYRWRTHDHTLYYYNFNVMRVVSFYNNSSTKPTCFPMQRQSDIR